ncbi:2OG-Fe(II) oxygenase [Microbulbifer sp. VTAC004]|uniref:2OG-Fe(II) oxygenase n=1 Tax=Microbulbifer sp. VTAC004 TaxID=3243386 RepID=UPI00403A492A
MILEQSMPSQLLDNVTAKLKTNEDWEQARIYSSRNGRHLLDRAKRAGGVAYPAGSEWGDVKEFLWKSTAPQLEGMCGIALEGLSAIQLLKYGVGDHFLPHQDLGGHFCNALFTVVGGLIEADVGGILRIHDPTMHSYKMCPGRIVAFPSEAWHESTRVEKGMKVVFVTWFLGRASFS